MKQQGTGVRQWVGFALLILAVCAMFAGAFAVVAVFLFKSCGYGC